MHDVARIDQPEARAPRTRRLDGGVAELRLGVPDRRLVALDLRGELIDACLLGVDLLARRVVLGGEAGIALEIELGVLEIGLASA
jgi:hypothetical protein